MTRYLGNAPDMSFTDYVSITRDFLFTRNHRTPDSELPLKQVDLSHFNNQDGDQYGPFDMTFVECGAYGEGWPKVHLFPEQTVQAHLDLKGIVLHPIHWGTFNLALHSWYEPMVRLTAAAKINNVKTAIPVVGDTTVYSSSIPSARWWEPAMDLSAGAIKTAVSEKDI